jgi:hypothetical protein
MSAAWRGSFAARSTWSDWDDPALMSQATLDDSVGAGSAVGPMVAAAAADMSRQPVVQQEVKGSSVPCLLDSSVHESPQPPAAQEPPASMSIQLPYQLAIQSAPKAAQLAPAANKPQLHSSNETEHKEQQAAQERCAASWLISTDPSPSFTAFSAAASASSPGDADARVLNRSHTADLRVIIPEAATRGDSLPAFNAGQQALHTSQLQVLTPALLLQQHVDPPEARATGPGSAMHMPHSASAPHLQHDDSYVVRSPTPSQASLCTRFSHASIASQWWLESCGGCGGSPTSAASLTGRHQGLRPFCDTKTRQPQPQQGLGASNLPQPGFCFSVGQGTVAGCLSSEHGQQLSVFETTQQPAAAALKAATAAAPAAVHPSLGGSALGAMDKTPGTGGFLRGESPQVSATGGV